MRNALVTITSLQLLLISQHDRHPTWLQSQDKPQQDDVTSKRVIAALAGATV